MTHHQEKCEYCIKGFKFNSKKGTHHRIDGTLVSWIPTVDSAPSLKDQEKCDCLCHSGSIVHLPDHVCPHCVSAPSPHQEGWEFQIVNIICHERKDISVISAEKIAKKIIPLLLSNRSADITAFKEMIGEYDGEQKADELRLKLRQKLQEYEEKL